jgi:hypothetical protein
LFATRISSLFTLEIGLAFISLRCANSIRPRPQFQLILGARDIVRIVENLPK